MLWNASEVRKKFEALNLFLYLMEIDDVLNERQTNLKMFLFNQEIFYITTNYLSTLNCWKHDVDKSIFTKSSRNGLILDFY